MPTNFNISDDYKIIVAVFLCLIATSLSGPSKFTNSDQRDSRMNFCDNDRCVQQLSNGSIVRFNHIACKNNNVGC